MQEWQDLQDWLRSILEQPAVRGVGLEESRGGPDVETLVADVLAGLKRRVLRFSDPQTPYRAWAMPQFIGRFGGDHDHLARLWEWHVMGDAVSEDDR